VWLISDVRRNMNAVEKKVLRQSRILAAVSLALTYGAFRWSKVAFVTTESHWWSSLWFICAMFAVALAIALAGRKSWLGIAAALVAAVPTLMTMVLLYSKLTGAT
jgi:hypothetical protein